MINWAFSWAAFLVKMTIYGTIFVVSALLVFTIATGV